MSAKRSEASKLVKRYGKMAEGYQSKIRRQAEAIDRLLKALEVAQFTLYTVANTDKNITAARKTATAGSEEIARTLAIHNNKEENDDTEQPG